MNFSLCCPYTSAYEAIRWCLVGQLGTTLLKKNDSPSPRSHRLSTAPQLGWGITVTQLDLLQVVRWQPQLLWVCDCGHPVTYWRRCFAPVIHHLWLLMSFCKGKSRVEIQYVQRSLDVVWYKKKPDPAFANGGLEAFGHLPLTSYMKNLLKKNHFSYHQAVPTLSRWLASAHGK